MMGYTLSDSKRNEVIRELQIPQITEFIEQYRRKWKEHVNRMSSDRIPKRILKYQLKGEGKLWRQWVSVGLILRMMC
jgi:hypothetical protein